MRFGLFDFFKRKKLLKLISRLSLKRGDISEEKVSQACENLKEKGFIVHFGKSERFSHHDRTGRDFFIITWKSNEKIWFQVKNSIRGVMEHSLKSRIPVIQVASHETLERAEEIIIKEFDLSLPYYLDPVG